MAVESLYIVAPIVGFFVVVFLGVVCVWSLFCYSVLNVLLVLQSF